MRMRSFGLVIASALLAGGLLAGGRANGASGKIGKSSTEAKRRSPTPRERLADLDRQRADLQKQIASLTAREKSLETELAAKHKFAAGADRSTETVRVEQYAAASATLALQRQAQANVAGRLAQLHVVLTRQALAERVGCDLGAEPRQALALYLTACELETAEHEHNALIEAIQRTEQRYRQPDAALAQSGQAPRDGTAATEIKRLEQELDQARADRKSLAARLEILGRLRRSVENEIAASKAEPSAAGATPTKRSAIPLTPSPARPTLTPSPRVTPPPGIREGTGLDLMVPEGTEIHAIDAGEVIYADRFKGYGNLAIIEHPDKILSLYGFLSQIGVAAGAWVVRGQLIGRSGFIEDKDRAGLRFEMRQSRAGREVLIAPRSWLPPGADLQRRLLRGTD